MRILTYFLLLLLASALSAQETVLEAAREIPVVYDVDVVVVGGSTRGVAAAVAAKAAGASVFLMSERPYLGADMCATCRLWLEDGEEPEVDLAKEIFLTKPDEGATDFMPSVRIPTPMEVKRALDDALLGAGVKFLYGSYAADVLHDSDGRVAGVTIVNRSGRQAVRAKVIIDATDRATAARICGAEFTPYPGGTQTFSRIVVGGDVGEHGRVLDRQVAIQGRTNQLVEYTLEIDMNDGSWPAFARADQESRDQIWAVPGSDLRLVVNDNANKNGRFSLFFNLRSDTAPDAQIAISKRPEFKGSVATAETRDFWRPKDEYGGSSQWYHWNSMAPIPAIYVLRVNYAQMLSFQG